MVDLTNPTTIGYSLVALGVLGFLLEATMPGFFVGVPATILIILGIYALVVPDFGLFTQWAPLIVVVIGVPATLFTIWSYRRMSPPTSEPTTQTASNLLGLEGQVTATVISDAPRGKVKIQHQMWSAISEEGVVIPVKARVRVLRVEGVILVVVPIE